MNEVKLNTKELERIARRLVITREAVGRRIASDIESQAKQIAMTKKIKDTGALINSIYTVTQKLDGYSKASGKAIGSNPGITTSPHPTPTGNIIANVGPSVDYAEYQEFGTSKMAARPFLTPAVEKVAQKYNDGKEWEELIK